ncbi:MULTISPECIES: (2Fe-2S)-binding protein [unclassified Clostridium]|uniref:(2Fe-2S)-binding protein n=1 Tax=unclassified Clostridium TaxID=2614128 RepID=UPI0002973138|nr:MULTISPECIES: (2Fe-2S)-binding protein [unclassified Clostridium]EKQ51678.1 MAG: NAD(P)H-nitrite reductase [Clostridium sp. Maddingley MBC34-26]
MDDNNVICTCHNVTVDDLNNVVKNGIKTFDEAQEITKVGTGCGKCVANNKVLFNELLLANKISENPVICGCKNVTVQDLDNAVKNGAKSFEEVQEITKIGTGCGHCIEKSRELVNQLLSK